MLKEITNKKYIDNFFSSLYGEDEIPILINSKDKQYKSKMCFSYNKQTNFSIWLKENEFSNIESEKLKATFFLGNVLFSFETKALEHKKDKYRITKPKSIFTSVKRWINRYEVKSNERVTLYLENHKKTFNILDISSRGLAFSSKEKILGKDELILNSKIKIEDFYEIKVNAKVRHIKIEDGEYTYGIEFTGIDWESYQKLFKYTFTRVYSNLKLLEDVSIDEIYLLNQETRNIFQTIDSPTDTLLETLQGLDIYKQKQKIRSSFLNIKNDKILTIGSNQLIYNKTYLGELLFQSELVLIPKARVCTYIGMAEELLSNPYFKNYIVYAQEDFSCHKEAFSEIEKFINDKEKFKFDVLKKYEYFVEDCDQFKDTEEYKSILLDEPTEFIRYCESNLSSLENDCYGYSGNKNDFKDFELTEAKKIYEDSDFKLSRKLFGIYRGKVVVAYAVAESYTTNFEKDNLKNNCRIYFIDDNANKYETIKALIYNVACFYKKEGMHKFNICCNYFDSITEHEEELLKPINTSLIGRALMSNEGLMEYKNILSTNPRNYFKYYKLTHSQSGFWADEEYCSGSNIGNTMGSIVIKEKIDYELLEKAINLMLENNDFFQARIIEEDGIPKQHVIDYQYEKIEFLDFSNTKEGYYKEYLEKYEKNMPFSLIDSKLYKFVMFKLNDSEGGFYGKLHHIISDAWTMVTTGATQVLENYLALKSGKYIEANKKPSYIDYISSEEEYNLSKRFIKNRQYWNEVFKTKPDIEWFQPYVSRPIATKAKRKEYIIKKEFVNKIHAHCKENKVSIFSLIMSIIAMYFYHTTSEKDIVLSTPILNRANVKEKETMGMFIREIPIRIKINEECTYSDFLVEVSKNIMSSLKNQKYPCSFLERDFKRNHGVEYNLFAISISYQNVKYEGTTQEIDYESIWEFSGEQGEALAVHIHDNQDMGEYIFDFDYLVDYFTEDQINEMYNIVLSILVEGMNNPDKKIKDFSECDYYNIGKKVI